MLEALVAAARQIGYRRIVLESAPAGGLRVRVRFPLRSTDPSSGP